MRTKDWLLIMWVIACMFGAFLAFSWVIVFTHIILDGSVLLVEPDIGIISFELGLASLLAIIYIVLMWKGYILIRLGRYME